MNQVAKNLVNFQNENKIIDTQFSISPSTINRFERNNVSYYFKTYVECVVPNGLWMSCRRNARIMAMDDIYNNDDDDDKNKQRQKQCRNEKIFWAI